MNLCIYRMCTVRFGICVHSCEQVSGIDGEERNLSSLSLIFSSSFFFLSLSLSLLLFLERAREKVWNSLSFAHIHIYICTSYCSLAYILTIDSTSSYEISESKSQTSRGDDDGNDNREKKSERWRVREGEKERSIRWTLMMLVTERTSSGVHWAELNERMMDGRTPLQGWGKQKSAYENEFVVNNVNCTFISFFLCMNWKKIYTSTGHYRLDYCPSTTVKGYQSR